MTTSGSAVASTLPDAGWPLTRRRGHDRPSEQLNTARVADFVSALAGIFEHSPWIAERAAAARPFTSTVQLLDAMCAVISAATDEEQLRLIRAHPELAGKAAIRNELTAESGREQEGAGLDSCTRSSSRGCMS